MSNKKIFFNKSNHQNTAIEYIQDVLSSTHTSGDGKYTKLCNNFFEKKVKTKCSLLTHSCTAALEISALLLDADVGDEVIMPSFTFVSTANAFVLRGLTPVFIDIREDNCNIDESLIEQAITPKTKAIVPVHYAGVACEMDSIMQIAKKYNLKVIEDAAQAYNSFYKDKHLGGIGHLGTFSFHETKNVISGEGGVLLINDESYIERAHIIREKGTNRTKFLKGQVDKYTWVDVGSSYLPSDIIAAYLYSNLEFDSQIQERRLHIWNSYHNAFKDSEKNGKVRLPYINDFAANNAHMFYLRFNDGKTRDLFIHYMRENDIMTPFHYIPLHSAPAGIKFGKYLGTMDNTNKISSTLVRLPIYYDLSNDELSVIIDKTQSFLARL